MARRGSSPSIELCAPRHPPDRRALQRRSFYRREYDYDRLPGGAMGKSKELISRRYVTRIAARMESLLRLDRFPYNFRLMDESLFDVAFHRVSSCCAFILFNVREKEEKRGKGGERINRDEINSPTSKGKDRNHFPYFVVITL